ncbi:MAG: type 2 lanthipeptide synthetase LanM [Mycolicibacterium sp.]|uniref:type 2 lanthipeptide synthetase LanM n=1 Tax=Mycolicibacterium sp. TaxID=2320850 RepID=UPI003D14FD28
MTAPSPQVLASIAARARPLHERIAIARTEPPPKILLPPLDKRRRERWLTASARGVESDFARRLSDLAIDDECLRMTLSDTETRCSDVPLVIPAWLEILVAAARGRRPCEAIGVASGEGHELSVLLAPLLAEAEMRLKRRTAPSAYISDRVADDLRDDLRARLSRLVSPCIDTEFAAFRAGTDQPLPVDLWHRFEQRNLAAGLFETWAKYPVLARLVGVMVGDWVDRNAEMLGRFDEDRAELAQLLGADHAAVLDTVVFPGSDPHNGHGSVAVCSISGRLAVYKPKDVSAEALLAEMLSWCNRIGADVGPPTEVLARDGYGWVGHVAQSPTDPAGAQRFYTRVGRLAALLFALGGNDAHAENVIAAADAPVIIDAETILQPTVPSEETGQRSEWMLDSMLLPRWLPIGGIVVDLSATGAPGTARRRTQLKWRDFGRPNMELVSVPVVVDRFPSDLRSPAGDLYRPEDHRAEILSGLRDGWNRIAGHVGEFTSPGGWLERFARVKVRVLLRMTRTYSRLIDTALDPALMFSGIDRSIHLDHLARAACDRDGPGWLALADAERLMLEDGDIPFFSVRADEAVLRGANGSVLIWFEESSLSRARRRLACLDDHNLELQSEVVSAALAMAPVDCRAKTFQTPSCVLRSGVRSITPTQAVEHVSKRILLQINRFGGPAAPLSLIAATPSQWAIDAPGPGLHDGQIGIAVALAAGAAATDDLALAQSARDMAAPVLTEATLRPRRLVLRHGLGGQDGVGGILLGLALFQRITPALTGELEAAFCALADAVTREDIDRAHPLDLLAGLPGFVAGLAAGAQVDWDADVAVGRAALRRLLDAAADYRMALDSGAASPCNGFAHGDAGLAALLAGIGRLGVEASEESRHLAVTLAAEWSVRYDPESGGWYDRGSKADPAGDDWGWCNGSPGIALAQTLVAECVSEVAGSSYGSRPDQLTVDLRRAQEGFRAEELRSDTLCCGAAGWVAVLHRISGSPIVDARTRARYRDLYDETVADLVSATALGELRLGAPPAPIQPLGLFHGLGGVLYAHAQSSQPHLHLPSVLAYGVDLNW